MNRIIKTSGIGNFWQFSLFIVFGVLSCLPIIAASQSEHRQQVNQTEKQVGQAKPAPKSTASGPKSPVAKPPQDPGETIRINSNLVAVPVSVTDAAGQPIRSLTADDFQVEEGGQSQQVFALGEPGKTPVELALLFDVSGSVNERFQFEQQAASRFLKEVLKPNDAASIFSIGFHPNLIQPRIMNVDKTVAAALSIQPTKDATAFFDSVVEAAQYLGKTAEPGTRRAVVVISDGEDTVSEKYGRNDALRELQRTDCLFYSINPSGRSIRLNNISLIGQEGMAALASATGGVAFLPDSFEDLDKMFRQITAELQAQYLLGYYSPDERADGGFRRISVRVQKRPDLRVRARQGYYAPKA